MKTIVLKLDGQPAQFTTKSLTFNGEEFFYSKMSNVLNDAENHNYAFAYDGKVVVLPYEAKDMGILNAIFSQVQSLPKRNSSASRPLPEKTESKSDAKQPDISDESQAEASSENDNNADGHAEVHEAVQEDERADETDSVQEASPISDTDETAQNEQNEQEAFPSPIPAAESLKSANTEAGDEIESNEDDNDETNTSPDSSDESTERFFSEVENAVENIIAEPEESENHEETAGDASDSQPNLQKKAKLKKSLLIFGLIIALFVLMSYCYFFFIAPNADTQTDPNANESQQYEDIDELINDLQ